MPEETTERERDRQVIAQFFAFLGEGRIDEWLSLIDQNVHVETPFAQQGSPTVFDGIAEVDVRFGDARKGMLALEFLDIDLLATEKPGHWVATCRSTGLFAGGVTYKNRYSWSFVLKGGLITEWVEYYDPQETMAVAAALAAQVAEKP